MPQNLTADRTRLIHAINEPRDWSTGLSKEQKDVIGIPDDLSVMAAAYVACACWRR